MLSTPEERFNEDLGADMLKKFGDEATTTAAVALLNRNVLAQTVHDVKKLHPGRTLKIADAYVMLSTGPRYSHVRTQASRHSRRLVERRDGAGCSRYRRRGR